MSIADEARAEEMCPACTAYIAYYPIMVGEWDCEHTEDEQAFMLAMADAIHGPNPEGEFADPGWRAAMFLDDAEVALSCGPAPYVMRITHNVEPWLFLALVNGEHLIGTRDDEGAELEHIANIGWLGLASRKPEAAPSDTDRAETVAEVAGWIRDGVFEGRDAGESLYPVSERLAERIVTALSPSQPVQVEVTTAEELEALPVGSVVQSADYPAKNGFALYRKHALNLWLFTENSAVPTVKLPAIVLHRPAALGGGDHE